MEVYDGRTFAKSGERPIMVFAGPHAPGWPTDRGWPDYFLFGDPHINYYEGAVYYDDITLETRQLADRR